MEIIRNVEEMVNKIRIVKNEGKSIGFVPTMGFLHNGHRSLIDEARKNNEIVVVSVFVNPTQFGPTEDFEKYPKDEKMDSELCATAGCDYLFMPHQEEMYGKSYNTYIDVFGLSEGLCGSTRPGHFRGVCTVVLKLFNIVKPNKAYFGQKDAQQLAVIKRMVIDMNIDLEVIGCPIIREIDGLAISSRNTYLCAAERLQALVLSSSLKRAKELIVDGQIDVLTIREEMIKVINTAKDSLIDYIEFVDSKTLKPVMEIQGEVLVAIAVKIGKTRLIDNMVVNK